MSGWVTVEGSMSTLPARYGRRRSMYGVLVASATLVSACAGDSDSAPTTTVEVPDSIVVQVPATPSDDILRIGVLLPRTGPGAAFGAPLLDGIELAENEINLVGGVNGRSIVVQVEDESTDPAAGLQRLIDEGADVIVGPASSNVASLVLGPAVEAGRAVCSPAATAMSLGDFPDSDLFFRTMPSEAVQVRALASLIEATGLGSATALAPDDEFGRRYVVALQNELRATGVELRTPILYDPTSGTLGPAAAQAIATAPPVLVVIGGLADGSRMLAALEASSDQLPPIFVNEALRTNDILDVLGAEGASLATLISGVGPAAKPENTTAGIRFADRFLQRQGGASMEFAAYAYDCVMTLALAAESTGSDDPRAIAAATPQITRAGQVCAGFAECRDLLLADRNIDYEGASGPLEFGSTGDASVAILDVFGFDGSGEELVTGSQRTG